MSKRNRIGSLSDLPIVSPKKGLKTRKFDPKKRLSDTKFVALAFFEALADNDTEAALDVIEGYLFAVGKPQLAKCAKLPTSTIYHALSPSGNPTLKTLARIVHAAACSTTRGKSLDSANSAIQLGLLT